VSDLLQRISSLFEAGPLLGIILLVSLYLWIQALKALEQIQQIQHQVQAASLKLPQDLQLSWLRQELGHPERQVWALTSCLPLLGLLGTVIGMIQIFEGMDQTGLRYQQALSSGIAQALITTQAGLLTALPGLFLSQHIKRKRQRLEDQLELNLHTGLKR